MGLYALPKHENSSSSARMLQIAAARPHKPVAKVLHSISGLVAEYIVAIDVTRVRFPADALLHVLVFRYPQAKPVGDVH